MDSQTELKELKAAVRRYLLADKAAQISDAYHYPFAQAQPIEDEYEQAYNALCELAEKD